MCVNTNDLYQKTNEGVLINMSEFYLPFFFAMIISYIITPFVKWFAHKVGAIDVPKDETRFLYQDWVV